MSLLSYLTTHVVLMNPSGSNISGSWEQTFTTSSTFFGVMELLTGAEQYNNSKKESVETYKLFCNLKVIEPTSVVEVDGTLYDIDSVNYLNIGYNQHTELILILRDK